LPQGEKDGDNGIAAAPGWAHTEVSGTAAAALPDIGLVIALPHVLYVPPK
jgi:hypothetical protein